jgi:very-short-patch-repair endonuclease
MLWKFLRGRRLGNAKFRRQFPVAGFIADFACLESKLIVEIDGGQHAERIEQDSRRTDIMRERGFRVVRFWNNDVLQNIDGVLMEISAALLEPPSPHPSPASGRGG